MTTCYILCYILKNDAPCMDATAMSHQFPLLKAGLEIRLTYMTFADNSMCRHI